METLLKTGEHKLFYQLVLYAGVAMVIYGSYNWYNNRQSDSIMNDTTPPNNPTDYVPHTTGETDILIDNPSLPPATTKRNSVGGFWDKK